MSFFKIIDKIPNKVNVIRAFINNFSDLMNKKREEVEEEKHKKSNIFYRLKYRIDIKHKCNE